MKRTLSMILIAAVIFSAFAIFSLNASAADSKLTITSNGKKLGEVAVGNEFIYNVALDSAGLSVEMGQAELRYDPEYIEIVEHGTIRNNGTVDMDAYSFPERICNTNLVTNYYALGKQVSYNFAKKGGVGAFTTTDHFFKVRLKVKKAGTAEIFHHIDVISSNNGGSYTRLIYDDKVNSDLSPAPKTVCTVEAAKGFVGDADGDGSITVVDATFIQRLTAGVKGTYQKMNADVNADNAVNLRDALCVLRYMAGLSTDTNIGKWIFESEAA